MIEAFPADRLRPPFRMSIQVGSSRSHALHLHVIGCEDGIEGGGELAFIVVEQDGWFVRLLGEDHSRARRRINSRNSPPVLGRPDAAGVRGESFSPLSQRAKVRDETMVMRPLI